ncbi:MAG: Fur family transcriptional regulator [Chloroflexi bacterium]|nr:Fur family transcriptional regulator [Chloroflexota bacterium]
MTVDILGAMQSAGARLTAPRRAVARVLSESHGWMSAEAITARARRHCPSIGLVTVYRTLELLESLGIARRVHGPTGCHGYALASIDDGHFIVCRACQQVIEFEGCDVDRVVRRVTRQTGFQVEAHMLELVGLCPDCGARHRTARRKP